MAGRCVLSDRGFAAIELVERRARRAAGDILQHIAQPALQSIWISVGSGLLKSVPVLSQPMRETGRHEIVSVQTANSGHQRRRKLWGQRRTEWPGWELL